MTTITRPATVDDCEHIIGLFQERVKSGEKRKPPSVDDLKTHCFNGKNFFYILVAELKDEDSSKVGSPNTGFFTGYLFYHYIYSTWQAKSIEITDLYVVPLPEYESICKELFHFICKLSIDENCARVQWQTKGKNDLRNLAKYFNVTNLLELEGWQVSILDKCQLKELNARC